MKFLRNEPLKKHTSFRIGGPAEYFCAPRSAAEIKAALLFAKEKKLAVTLIGAGTNLLVPDEGLRGLVVKLGRGLNEIKLERGRAIAGAGVLLPRLVDFLARRGLGGLEFLAGIPGSVGGAVIMNAGAWRRDIGAYVEAVRALDRAGREKNFKRGQLKFGYRSSKLQSGRLIVTGVVLKTRKKDKKAIMKQVREYAEARKSSQPLGIPNCGSVFKNPKGASAGRLIEEAGCKGRRIGDAQVSCKHANFIVNLGEAKAADVIALMRSVQQSVRERHKIKLEPELKIMVKSPL